MSREIKFRAWNSAESIMYENVGINPHAKDYRVFDADGAICDMYGSTPTLMQYTGLKDKQGKEIYEGDLLAWSGWIGEVFFDEDFGAWRAKNIGTLGSIANLEIVGNVYEHSDLLTQR